MKINTFKQYIKEIHFNKVKDFPIKINDLYSFKAKDNNTYYIGRKDHLIHIYILQDKEVEKYVNSKIEKYKVKSLYPIAKLAIDLHNDYFTTFDNDTSIEVNPEYRRKGLATALINFAEFDTKLKYKPSEILSPSFTATLKSMGKL